MSTVLSQNVRIYPFSGTNVQFSKVDAPVGVGNSVMTILLFGASIQFVSRYPAIPAPVFPNPGHVRSADKYGPSGSDFTGNEIEPQPGDVRTGAGYGANGTEFTGTLNPGGGNAGMSKSRVVNA